MMGEIFDPFVQVGADRSGFGLGLAICRQAAEAHGGKVHVRNLPGKGCVFSLELPRTRCGTPINDTPADDPVTVR